MWNGDRNAIARSHHSVTAGRRGSSVLVFGTLATVAALLAGASAAGASETPVRPLFELVDVKRDTVSAGTPAAFEVAFKDAIRNEAVRSEGDARYRYVPLALIPMTATRTALVSTAVNECTLPTCLGRNAVHYLDHGPGRPQYPYTVQGEWLDIGASGTFGVPAQRWGVTGAIAAAPVLYTESGGTWQGVRCGVAILTELTPGGPVEIAHIPIAYSNDGAGPADAVKIEGFIQAADKGRSFTVSYQGTKRFSETYLRGPDGQYRIDGKSALPGC